jgi:hypothetical protein
MADEVQWITVKRLPKSDWPSRTIFGTWEKQIMTEQGGVSVPMGIMQ